MTSIAILVQITSMRRSILPTILLAAALFPLAAGAHGNAGHAETRATTPREQQEWGIAGDRRSVTRTIVIRMSDRMRFTPDRITVRQGETIRFVLRNNGAMLHEMVIGTADALAEHAGLMKKFPGMEHDEPWMAHVPAGGKGEIVWTFNRPGRFEFACLIPGHFEAGMIGRIDVKPLDPARGKAPATGLTPNNEMPRSTR